MKGRIGEAYISVKSGESVPASGEVRAGLAGKQAASDGSGGGVRLVGRVTGTEVKMSERERKVKQSGIGKGSEERQSRLILEKGKTGKRVSFKEGDTEGKSEIEGRMEEIQKAMAGLKEDYERKIRVLEDRMANLERSLFEKREEKKKTEEENRVDANDVR